VSAAIAFPWASPRLGSWSFYGHGFAPGATNLAPICIATVIAAPLNFSVGAGDFVPRAPHRPAFSLLLFLLG